MDVNFGVNCIKTQVIKCLSGGGGDGFWFLLSDRISRNFLGTKAVHEFSFRGWNGRV